MVISFPTEMLHPRKYKGQIVSFIYLFFPKVLFLSLSSFLGFFYFPFKMPPRRVFKRVISNVEQRHANLPAKSFFVLWMGFS